MDNLTISQDPRLVIPKSFREILKLKPGQKLQALAYNNRIELIPVLPIEDMRVLVCGIDATVDREIDRG